MGFMDRLLSVGEDGHVASIFPDHPSSEATQASVVGVTNAPKLPPDRISLSLATINRSREVWFLASGGEKANAVGRVFRGDPALPAAHVRGAERTVWFVDEAAAAHLPFHECGL